LGRDYTNNDLPIGIEGTPSAGLPFYKISDETLEKFSFLGGPDQFKSDYIEPVLAAFDDEDFKQVDTETDIVTGALGGPFEDLTAAEVEQKASDEADDLIKAAGLPADKRTDIVTVDATGASHTIFWDDIPIGTPIIQNWPTADAVERRVAPRFVQNAKISSSGLLTNSSIDINTAGPLELMYPKRLVSTVDVSLKSVFTDLADDTLNTK